MDIYSFRHKALRKFFETGNSRGLSPLWVPKLARMLGALNDAQNIEELATVPNWKLHELTGVRKGTWSMRITGNWRLTFRLEGDDLYDLNLEDYH